MNIRIFCRWSLLPSLSG